MKKGFSVIEITIVLAIFLIIAGVSLPLAGGFGKSASFEQLSSELSGWLRQARSKADAGFNSSAFGVKFFTDHYTFFEGPSYSLRNQASDISVDIPDGYSLSWDLPGNNSEIVFIAGTGRPQSEGTVTIANTQGDSRIIAINNAGLIINND